MMSIRPRSLVLTTLLCSSFLLAACKPAEEQAEEYFQSGLVFLEDGETEKALLQFRNVFQHDGFHREAREVYADTLMELGRIPEAYGQYLRLIEQYPNIVEARETLAEIAVTQNNWGEVERHGQAAIALAPDRLGVRAIDLVLRYRAASLGRDEPTRIEVAQQANELLAEIRATQDTGDNAALVRVVIDDLAKSAPPEELLPVIEAALARDPQAFDLNMARAQLLEQLGDSSGTGAQLEAMVQMYPGNTQVQELLTRWYLSQRDFDGAEAYIRSLAGDDTGPVAGHFAVIQFLTVYRGEAAARTELSRLIEANAGTDTARTYTAQLARIQFEAGEADDAIATMRTALDGASGSDETRTMQAALAQMLRAQGDVDEANALITAVLAQDSRHIPALKLEAQRLIQEDKPGEAIIALRTALDQSPRDSEVLTLMAYAHERDGDIELMSERLALAVEVSNEAAEESIRYARFLLRQERPIVATAVLQDARARTPDNLDVLMLLAQVLIEQRQWVDAQSVVEDVRAIGTDTARRAAPNLQAAILQGQNRTEDSLAILEQQIGGDRVVENIQEVRAVVQILQSQVRGGKIDEARAFLDATLEKNPDNPELLLLDANMSTLMGDYDDAEAGYRALMADFPTAEVPARFLVNLLLSTNRPDEARTVLEEALVTRPEAPNLLWMQASFLEKDGDLDGAIGIYERLYEADSNDVIVANNLASMITTHRDDAESLERAWAIARRLRGTQVPEFQDTYGWIAYRRGDFETALEYLAPAAEALDGNALAQFHLGMTYHALGRSDQARDALDRALALAPDSPLPQFETARTTLANLAN